MRDDAFQRAVALLKGARFAVAITGAGISTPSGIPDFRSDTGLWQRYDPMEVASLWGFRLHPERFYAWIRPLLEPLLTAQPNPAHHALARLEAAGRLHAIITQNIDGLHQKAGSRRVYEVHGNLEHMVCLDCGWRGPLKDFLTPEILTGQALPRCPTCGSVLKPNVVLFGENLPWGVWLEAQRAVEQADVVLVAGSSLEVAPVSQLPYEAYQRGAQVILVNLSPTYMDRYAAAVLRGDVAQVLPALADAVLADRAATDSA
ncbi:MAG: NAD-dependent deacylase [Chloroflexi bacterium]|nr:NAD-dependent deacylase [Chloroflexota bacterium]